MRRIKILAVVLLVLLLGALSYAQKSFGPEKGWLVIDGGQEPLLPAVVHRFVTLAGGAEANIVLIPTAMHGNDNDEPPTDEVEAYKKHLGVKNITVLHTRDRAVANSEAFVEPLRKATGVWFTGGRANYIADAYSDTLTQKELAAVLARGGVIGGSSAGAIGLGAAGLVPGNTTSGFQRIIQAFGFIHDVFIIPHAIKRNWESRMATGMATHPGMLGIGVDEGAALVVHGNDCEVIGDSKVLLPDGSGPDGKGYRMLTSGARFNLEQAMKAAKVAKSPAGN